LKGTLKEGTNVIEIEAENEDTGPAGLLCKALYPE
jgi:hypothetical protein